MKAPTPVSALIHSATLVIAGIFIVIRLLPLLSLSANVMLIISCVGIITALYSSLCAICQTNVKKVLAYSTSANIGLMFVAIGFGNVDLAVAYVFIHGLLKSALFLSYGGANNEYEERKSTNLPISFLVGSVLLAGLLFAPMNIKELLYDSLKDNLYFKLEYLLVCLMSAIYIFRLNTLYFSYKRKYSLNLKEGFAVWGLLLLLLCATPHITYIGIGVPFLCALVGVGAIILITLKNKKNNEVGFVYNVVSKGFYLDRVYYVLFPYLFGKFSNNCSKLDDLISSNKIILVYLGF